MHHFWAVLPTLKALLEMIALLILHHQHLEYIMELMVEILVLVQDLAHFFQFVLMRMGRIRMVFKLLMSTIVAILVLDLVTLDTMVGKFFDSGRRSQ